MALMPVADALEAVLSGAKALPAERVTLEDAYHRVLAADVAALRTQPPSAMSAMDGYAVHASDVITVPIRLKVIGEIAAGRPFNGRLHPGEAIRIFTGGVVPEGADAIVIQEDTAREGDTVLINEPAARGRYIRPAGADFREGDVLLRAGTHLTDRDLSLIASMNHTSVMVRQRPKVALFATGDELVMPGSQPGPGQIIYSNGYALRALARAEGAEIIDLGVVGDTIEATAVAIRRGRDSGADILISTGGVSVGDHDMIKRALDAEGVELAFWKIALRPGKPMMHGRLERSLDGTLGPMRVLGLPGNPVSSYVCAFLFMAPLIRALSGRQDIGHALEAAVLGAELPENDQRQDYLRARLELRPDGLPLATPIRQQDSSLLANLSAAQALIVRAPHAPAAEAGSLCAVLKLPL